MQIGGKSVAESTDVYPERGPDLPMWRDQMGWPNEYIICLRFGEIGRFGPHEFELWLS